MFSLFIPTTCLNFLILLFWITPVFAAPDVKTPQSPPLTCASCACLEEVTTYMFDEQPVQKDNPHWWKQFPHCQGARAAELKQSEEFRLYAIAFKEKAYAKRPRKICEADWRTLLKGLKTLAEGEQKQNCKIPENVKNWTPVAQSLGARCMEDQYLTAQAHNMGVRAREGKLKNGCTERGNHVLDMLIMMRMDTNIFLEKQNILSRLENLLKSTPDLLQSILLLYIHADQHPSLQKAAVERYKTLLLQGAIKPRHISWLADRQAILENGKQIYGYQTRCEGGRAVLDPPLRDPLHVDARRAAIGLPALAEHLEQRSTIRCISENRAIGR